MFDLERLKELRLCRAQSPGAGFETLLVTEPEHPFEASWWPPGHVLGWEHTFVHELHHLLGAIRAGRGVSPQGADFEDGYRAAEVGDAIVCSGAERTHQPITYRTLR